MLQSLSLSFFLLNIIYRAKYVFCLPHLSFRLCCKETQGSVNVTSLQFVSVWWLRGLGLGNSGQLVGSFILNLPLSRTVPLLFVI